MPGHRVKPYASFVFRDESGSSRTLRVGMQEAEAAPALAAADELAAALALASDAALMGRSVTYPHQRPPVLRQENENRSDGVLIFSTAEENQVFALDLLDLPESLFIGNEIDVSAPQIIALADVMIGSIWLNPFEYQLTGLIAALRQER